MSSMKMSSQMCRTPRSIQRGFRVAVPGLRAASGEGRQHDGSYGSPSLGAVHLYVYQHAAAKSLAPQCHVDGDRYKVT